MESSGSEETTTVTIKKLPAELYTRLKRSAGANRRSVNSEVIVCLERAFGARPAVASETLDGLRELRSRLPRVRVTDRELDHAKNEGRA